MSDVEKIRNNVNMTEFILTPRGSGKTTRLIKISAETKYPIVCVSENAAKEISDKAISLGIDIPQPVSFHSCKEGFLGKSVRGILIDNVELLLRHLAGVPVIAVTASKED